MSAYGYIYRILNPITQKSYIGQTTGSIDARWKRHCNLNRKECIKLHRAICKYGKDSFFVEKLCSCDDQEALNEAERMFISYFNSIRNGYNCDSGGKSGGHHSLSTRKKISKSNLGRICTKEVKEKISKSLTGRTGYSCYNSEEVFCIETNCHYGSAAEAARILNLCQTSISSCCRGKLASTGGKHFYYTSVGLIKKEYNRCRKVLCVELNMIFDSIKDAADFVKIKSSGISRALVRPHRAAGSYHWKYAEDKNGKP